MNHPATVGGYSIREVANLLNVTEAKIRAYARSGFTSTSAGENGELQFSFQDLLLLRTAKALEAARIPRRRIRLALSNLAEQLDGRPLTAVRISALGSQVVAREGGESWNAESGQTFLEFEAADLTREPGRLHHVPVLTPVAAPEPEMPDAEERYETALVREADGDTAAAIEAYGEALGLDPTHSEAHVNVGRLLHESGDLTAAEEHYRQAIILRHDEPTAWFNLGVVLQDTQRMEEASRAYERALALDASYADAHYNLASVLEALGQRTSAFRHLRTYRSLVSDPG
jgi:tetratricopeptide (TPR) repeat protein